MRGRDLQHVERLIVEPEGERGRIGRDLRLEQRERPA
jgi:hypothetical protein